MGELLVWGRQQIRNEKLFNHFKLKGFDPRTGGHFPNDVEDGKIEPGTQVLYFALVRLEVPAEIKG